MRKVLLTASIIFISQSYLHAQPSQRSCDSLLRYYGTAHTTSKMFLTKNGGQLFAGRLESNDSNAAAYLLKINDCGKAMWEKYYAVNPGYRSWYARAFDESAAGDVFALINADSIVGITANQMRLFKINAHGEQQWMSTYADQSFDVVPYGVCATADGGALAGGWKGFWAVYPNTAILVKFDTNGSVEWTKSYGSGLISSIKQTTDGYVFIRYHWTQFRLRSYLYKINKTGVVQWHVETPPDYRYKYTDQYADWAVQVMPKADNSSYTVVRTQGAGFYPDTIFLTKYTSAGAQLWNKKYAYQPYQEIHSIQNTNDDGYLLCGNYSQPVNDTLGVYLMRIDTNGDTVWTSKVTKTKFTSDYPLIITGGTDAYDMGNNKYNIGGLLQVNTGRGANVRVHFSSLLIKLPGGPQSTSNVQYTKLNKPGLLKISPNPVASFCIVELPELKSGRAQLEVSDAYGRILQTISVPSSQKYVQVDMHLFTSGIYTMNMLSEAMLVASSKLIVQ